MSARSCIALLALCALVQLGVAINGGSGCQVSGPARRANREHLRRATKRPPGTRHLPPEPFPSPGACTHPCLPQYVSPRQVLDTATANGLTPVQANDIYTR